ncbi:MAG: transcriptional repressor [Acidobacteria bacterium]|jgi:Fe2+ or Zn2+ uptake regulation protein|nr:transcriptional repressor [Acidobacteriota bacterium]
MSSRENIKDLGLTKQREVILQVIREADEHLTANEIFDKAKQLLPGISFATVYNSLRFLKESGHIGEISFGNGASRFDAMASRHDHALCTKCGKLVDMEIELPNEVINFAAQFSKFKLESIELTLRGLCPECSK